MQLFTKHWFFALEENFAMQKFAIYLHLYSCLGTHGYIILWRDEASHEISEKFSPHEK